MIGLLMLVGELVRGAQAPRLPEMAPSPSQTSVSITEPAGSSWNKNDFGEGAEMSRRGACAPQRGRATQPLLGCDEN